VITSMLKLDAGKRGLGGIIDHDHIGVAGHSLGGVTTLGVAFRSCCRDKRIDAAIALAGTPLIRGTDFKGIDTPLMLVHGDADRTVQYEASISSFHRAQGPRFFITVLGGMHGGYLDGTDPASQAVQRATTDFWWGELNGDTTALADLPAHAAVPGVTTLQTAG
jgi:dienelactone hydrolase